MDRYEQAQLHAFVHKCAQILIGSRHTKSTLDHLIVTENTAWLLDCRSWTALTAWFHFDPTCSRRRISSYILGDYLLQIMLCIDKFVYMRVFIDPHLHPTPTHHTHTHWSSLITLSAIIASSQWPMLTYDCLVVVMAMLLHPWFLIWTAALTGRPEGILYAMHRNG